MHAQQEIHKQFPRSTIHDIALAIDDGGETAALRIATAEARHQLAELKNHTTKLESGFFGINLGKQKAPVDLNGKCFWVPASVRHEPPKDHSGLSRYSFFVYGGVNIQPQINTAQGSSAPLAGTPVGESMLGQTIYRVWGGDSKSSGASWSTVDPGTVENYRDSAGLPNRNSGRFVSEGILMSTDGVRERTALAYDGNRGGLPELIIPGGQVHLTRVSGANPSF